MSNNYMKRSLIYGIGDIALFKNIRNVESARSRIMEMQRRTQQGNVYMNEKHSKAESESDNKQDLHRL